MQLSLCAVQSWVYGELAHDLKLVQAVKAGCVCMQVFKCVFGRGLLLYENIM